MCTKEPETINHCLFLCDNAQALWNLAELPTPQNGFSTRSIHSNMAFLLNKLEDPESIRNMPKLAYSPKILWQIWKNRNTTLIQGRQTDPDQTLTEILIEAKTWEKIFKQDHKERRNNTNNVDRQLQLPRTENILKVKWHVFWNKKGGLNGGCYIIYNEKAEVLIHARHALLQEYSQISSECQGLIWVLKSLRELQMDNVEVEIENGILYKATIQPEHWPRLLPWTMQIKALTESFKSFMPAHVMRKRDCDARKIAKSVVLEGLWTDYVGRGKPEWLKHSEQGSPLKKRKQLSLEVGESSKAKSL